MRVFHRKGQMIRAFLEEEDENIPFPKVIWSGLLGRFFMTCNQGLRKKRRSKKERDKRAPCTGAIAELKGFGSGEAGSYGTAKALEKAFEPVWNWTSRRYQAAVAKELKKYGESSSKPCFLH